MRPSPVSAYAASSWSVSFGSIVSRSGRQRPAPRVSNFQVLDLLALVRRERAGQVDQLDKVLAQQAVCDAGIDALTRHRRKSNVCQLAARYLGKWMRFGTVQWRPWRVGRPKPTVAVALIGHAERLPNALHALCTTVADKFRSDWCNFMQKGARPAMD